MLDAIVVLLSGSFRVFNYYLHVAYRRKLTILSLRWQNCFSFELYEFRVTGGKFKRLICGTVVSWSYYLEPSQKDLS